RVLILGVHAEDEHWQARPLALDVLEDLDAAAPREPDVEHDGVPVVLPNQVERLLTVCRLTDLAHIRGIGKRLLETLPDDWVVVDDEDSQWLSHALTVVRRGTCARTVVPVPAAPEIARPPPTSCARSRIPTRPIECVLAAVDARPT